MFNAQMQKVLKPFVNRSMALAEMALENSRNVANVSANWCESAVRPVQTLTETGLKLNSISHSGIAKLVGQQADFVKGSLDATAKRLHVVAKADSVKKLVDDQVALMPATRERLMDDARQTLDVLGATREELTELFRDTVTELSKQGQGSVRAATKRARKTAKTGTRQVRRTAKTAKKTPRKAAASVKKAATKRTTKKAGVRRKTTAARSSR